MTTMDTLGSNHFPMLDKYGNPVKLMHVFEISFRSRTAAATENTTFLMPYYSRYMKLDCENGINDLIGHDVFKTGKFPAGSETVPRDPGTPVKKRSILGIHNKKQVCYIVIKLDDALNCRFSTSFSPFTVGEDVAALGIGDVFFESRLLNHNVQAPVEIPDEGERPVGTYGKTKWAYFVFDGTAVNETQYAYRFNINVELFDDHTGDVMPITIDPDVGHPGGGSS